MSHLVRIAICQLETHPAAYLGPEMWLEEPFLDGNKHLSLSYLSTKGFPVGPYLNHCKNTYLEWHRQRLAGILDFLKKNPTTPTITLFPEFSIPFQCLDLCSAFCKETSSTLLAGTHSFQDTRESRKAYRTLGIGEKQVRRLAREDDPPSILPMILQDEAFVQSKFLESPFERTSFAPIAQDAPTIYPIQVPSDGGKVPVLPLICSEALNMLKLKIGGEYTVCAVLSYDAKPAQFAEVIQLQVRQARVVTYCNDGRYGGSTIRLPLDARSADWFFNSGLEGRLPPGDSILIAEVDLDNLHVQGGISNPKNNFRLIKLARILYGQSEPDSSLAKEVGRIARLDGNEERASALKALQISASNDLDLARFQHLSTLYDQGRASNAIWECLAEDCVLPLNSLKTLESGLAGTCFGGLKGILLDYPSDKSGVEDLRRFLQKSKDLGGEENIGMAPPKEEVPEPYIFNRDDEATALLKFIEDRKQPIAVVLGLQQIGKSRVIEKVLTFAPKLRVKQIRINSTMSADLLAHTLTRGGKSHEAAVQTASELTSERLRSCLEGIDLVWLENSEELTTGKAWRNSEIEALVAKLTDLARGSRTKILFETRFELPIQVPDPSVLFKKRIYGLEKNLIRFGISYFDYQLRRVDLNPSDFSDETKKEIVDKVGGHPVALAICADAAVGQGYMQVLEDLRKRSGIYTNILRQLLPKVELGDIERTILKLLSRCRLPLPREAIGSAFEQAVSPHVRNLLDYCLVEVDGASNVSIAALVANHFEYEEVPLQVRNRFHVGCGEAYFRLWNQSKDRIELKIESEIHFRLAGRTPSEATSFPDADLETAKQFYDKQDYRSARIILDNLLTKKKTEDILRLSALADAKCNFFDEALKKARPVFRANPRDSHLLSEIAKIALSQGRDDIAEELIKTARAANMEDQAIRIVEGRMLMRRGDLPGAEEAFKAAVVATTRNAWPYYYLGKVYLKLGRIEDAIATLEDGQNFLYKLSFSGERVSLAIKTQLAVAYLFSDEENVRALAAPILEPLYEEYPDKPEVTWAYCFLCIRRDGVGTGHNAFKAFDERKIKNREDRALYHLYYGLFFLMTGDRGSASQQFAEAHKCDRNNVYVMMKMATTYYDMALDAESMNEDEIARGYASSCASILKSALQFDPSNELGKDLRIALYRNFKIELSKI